MLYFDIFTNLVLVVVKGRSTVALSGHGMLQLVLSFSLIQLSISDQVETPNVLIINIQQIGWGDVGVYTPWRSDTPGIDKIARYGLVLDQLYCETSAGASQAAILSGKLPASWGFYNSNNAQISVVHEDSSFILPSDMSYLPQKLANHSSIFIGRWLLGQTAEASPLNYGFDHFYGVVSDRTGKYNTLPNPGLYNDTMLIGRLFQSPGLELEDGVSNLTQHYKEKAINFINKSTRPFYVHLSLDALVHSPYRSKEWINSSLSSRRTHFGDALKEVDNAISAIYNELVISGVVNSTIILVAGDSTALANRYSGGNNAPFSGMLHDTTEGGVRVPAIISYPDLFYRRIKKQRSEQVMNYLDLHTTLLGMTRVGLGSNNCTDGCVLTGIDLSDALLSDKTRNRTVPLYRGRTLMALRSGRYKAHRLAEQSFIPGQFLDDLTNYKLQDFSNAPLLYDVIADPSERFYIGDGFGGGSDRYVNIMSDVSRQFANILSQVPEDGGLLNDCDVSLREWSPQGCHNPGDCEVCDDLCMFKPQSKLEICSIPFWI